MAASASTGRLDYIRSLLRGVLVVHATRHYEYSACVPGHQLLSESDVLACFVVGRGASDDATTGNLLKRRATSEGKFFCGQRSGALMLLARSNVCDSFPGCEYHEAFERSVHIVASAEPSDGDAIVLDAVRMDTDRAKFKQLQQDAYVYRNVLAYASICHHMLAYVSICYHMFTCSHF